MYPPLWYHAGYFHRSKTPLYSVHLSLSKPLITTLLFFFFLIISIVLPWLVFVSRGLQGLHSWHRAFLVKERTEGGFSPDPCCYVSNTGFTILAVGQDPLLFFGQAKKGRRNPVSFPAREREKEKGRENSLVSEGKRGKET